MKIVFQCINPTKLYTAAQIRRMVSPGRYDELIELAFEAYANGYPKAGRMLAKIAERYYSCDV